MLIATSIPVTGFAFGTTDTKRKKESVNKA